MAAGTAVALAIDRVNAMPACTDQFVPTLPILSGGTLPTRRRVVITGIGVLAPSGIGKAALWQHLAEGRSAIRPIDRFDTAGYPTALAAPIPDFDAREFMKASHARALGRLCQLVWAAAQLAVRDGDVPEGLLASLRAGFFLGTAAGPVEIWEEQARAFTLGGYRAVRPTFPLAASPHSAVGNTASQLGIRGPIATYCSDCPSGLDAIHAAYRQIQAGVLDVAFSGGADAPISPLLFGSFAKSGTLADGSHGIERAARPFDRTRNGFVIGEGAAILVLEAEEHARARGARVYGEIVGVGVGRDRPTYLGATDPSGEGFLAAASLALHDAGMSPEEVDVVNAHAPGMPCTDLAEANALRALFGRRHASVPVTSIKGGLGHPLAAAGVLQVVTSVLAAERGVVPPTVNCDDVDPACDLDVVRGGPRPVRASTCLITSHGFAGNTTSIVLHPAQPMH